MQKDSKEKVINALTSRLSGGDVKPNGDNYSNGFVTTLAKAYETARNALEYRAENLVRRAAIERILKRLMLLNRNPEEIARNLLDELRWAKYLDITSSSTKKRDKLKLILQKYIDYKGSIPGEWVVKIASAEIEEFFDLNKDYNQFTFFAFQVLKQKINLKDDNLDLLIFYSVDKIYAGSDLEQIAYHIISLDGEITSEKMEEGWKLFNIAQKHKSTPRINKFVRRQMPPLVLLRDIYFYSPTEFKETLKSKEKFDVKATEVLENQLKLMSGKIKTAGVRSVVYVFLTKMVLAFGLEAPLETLIFGQIDFLPLAINLTFPPFIMWAVTSQIKIPNQKQQDALKERSYYILENFEELKNEDDILNPIDEKPANSSSYIVFSVIYGVVFLGIFLGIYLFLSLFGFKLFNKFIFVFFLTIIAFFAYRISQIASSYTLHRQSSESSSIIDMFLLPILTIGSRLSQGLTKLNFIGLIFDFILEAPFKMILGFLDDWVQFLSVKKEQQVLD